MKFLRKKDDDCYRLASMQARIFEKSSNEGIASYFFIQKFMNSMDAKSLDDLSFLLSGSSEIELYFNCIKAVKRTKGQVYPSSVMHWIGFFYRYASYLTGISSMELFKKISPKYLNQVYPLYHGLDIVKAIEMVFESQHIEQETPNERFINLYRLGKINI